MRCMIPKTSNSINEILLRISVISGIYFFTQEHKKFLLGTKLSNISQTSPNSTDKTG